MHCVITIAPSAVLLLAAASGADGFTVAPRSGKSSSLKMLHLGATDAVAAATTSPLDVHVTETAFSAAATFQRPLSSSPNFGIPDEILLERATTSALSSSSSVLAAAAAAPPASTNVAAGFGVTITDIMFDGKVPKTEADEYVVISNQSKAPIDISKYYVYVATTGTQGPTFYFPKDTPPLKPGASVRIYTNEIHKETGGYSFGSGKAIWSNSGGLAVLKDANGKKLTEYKYKVAK